ncbi:MAG: copper chaperone [Thermotogaceae bacterium]|nr:copper chaperone [Thermotogaceae bacterium]
MKYVLNVPDMSCNHCVMRITKALEELGVKDFEVKLENKKVYLSTDELDRVLGKLEEIGYPATIES